MKRIVTAAAVAVLSVSLVVVGAPLGGKAVPQGVGTGCCVQ